MINERVLRWGNVLAMLLLLVAQLLEVPALAKGKREDRKKVPDLLSPDMPLSLHVTPRMAIAGTFVQALVRVYPNVENRLLRVSVESTGYFRSSDVALDGADAKISHLVPLRALPAGSYDVVAVVYGSEGERARSLEKFELKSVHQGN
jgi:hypothetical protein